MITAQIGGSAPIKVNFVVNRGQWFGETWLISNALQCTYLVEGGNEQEALDNLIDSKHGPTFIDDEFDGDYENYLGGFFGNAGEPVSEITLSYMSIHKCTVNYFAKKDSI